MSRTTQKQKPTTIERPFFVQVWFPIPTERPGSAKQSTFEFEGEAHEFIHAEVTVGGGTLVAFDKYETGEWRSLMTREQDDRARERVPFAQHPAMDWGKAAAGDHDYSTEAF